MDFLSNIKAANPFHLVAANDAWNLRAFLENAFSTLSDWFGLAVMLIGIVAIFWAIWLITSGLMSQGKKQVNWALAIILLLVGGALSMATGFEFVKGIAEGGRTTIEDLGGQSAGGGKP